MADVFISYSHFDRAVVGGLQATLKARGKDVWVDDQQIAPASKWADALKAAIETADAFVFVISPDSAVSPECRQELAYATSLNKRIIPCVVRATNLEVLPDPLPSRQFVPARGVFEDDIGTSIEQLIAAIETDLEWTQEHTRWGRKAIDWEEHGRDRSFLVRGSELRTAEDWLARSSGRRPEPTPSQNAFVLASRKVSDRRQRTWRGALGVGLIVALVLAGLALVQRHSAEVQRNNAVVQRNHARVATILAKSRQLAWEAEADLSSGPQKSLKLGLSSTLLNGTGTSEESLRLALADTPMRAAIDSGAGAGALTAWDPEGGQLAVTGPGGTVAVWNPLTLHLLRVLHAVSAAAPTTLSYSPDGRWIASVTAAGSVSVWTVATGAVVSTTDLNGLIHADVVKAPDTFPRASDLWLAGTSPQLVVWGNGYNHIVGFQPASGHAGSLFNTASGALFTLVANDTGTELFVIYGKIYDVIDLKSGKQVVFHSPSAGFAFVDDNACWTSDGKSVVTWNNEEAADEFLRTWNAATGVQESFVSLGGSTITAAACGAGSSNWVSAGNSAGEVRLYVGGTTIQLNGHNSTIGDIASSPNGAYLGTASQDGTARVWDSTNGNLLRLLSGDGAPIETVSFSPNNALVATVDNQSVVRLWDAGVGQPNATMVSDGPGQPYPLGFTADGASVYGLQAEWSAASKNATAHIQALHAVLWSAATGAVERSLALPADLAAGKLACPENLQILNACDLTAPSNLVTNLPSPSGANQPVAVGFSPDGQLVAYGQPGSVSVLGAGGQVTDRLAVTGTPTGLSFVGSTHELVVMTPVGIKLWTPGGTARTFSVTSPPIDAELSSNGQRLAAGVIGGTVSVWNTATGVTVASLRPTPAGRGSLNGHLEAVPLRVALNADGSEVTIATTFQSVQTWTVAAGRLVAARLVQSPGDTNTGGLGAGGPWPIAELRPSAGGTAILAVDFPQIGAGDEQPPATAVVYAGASAAGAPEATFVSRDNDVPAINPGAALSADGTFILSGVSGLAPTPPGGTEAVYQVVGGQLLADLQSVPADPNDGASPSDPWSPSGVSVLVGDGIYPCDACGTLAQMQATAKVRLAWLQPLSVAHPNPPAGDPYG